MTAPARRPPLASVLRALRESPIGIFAFRRDGHVHIIARNRSLPPAEVDLGGDEPVLGTPAAQWRAAVARVLDGKPLHTLLEVGEAAVDLHVEPWRDARGHVIGGVGLSVDVTEREKALRHRRSRGRTLRRISDHVGDALGEVDLEGRLRFATPSAAAYLGCEPDQLLGRSAADLVHPADRARVQRLFARAVSDGRGYETEARIVRPDGSVRWTTTRTEFVQTAGGEPRLLLFVRDVTELREERLRRERRGTLTQGVSELSRELLALPPEALGEGLARALERTCRLTGVDACTLYAMDPHTMEQQRMGWSAPGAPVPPMPDRRDALRMVWLGRELVAGRTVRIESPEDWPAEAAAERARMEADGVRSALILGVRSEAGLVGTLQLLGLQAPRPVPGDDVPTLRILAEMLIGAYRRKLTLDAMERGRALEAEVAGLSRHLIRLRGDEVEAGFRDATALAMRIARAERGVLRLPADGGEGRACVVDGSEDGPSLPEAGACPWVEAQLGAGRSVVFSDHQRLPREARADVRHLRGLGVNSMLAVPLRTAEGSLGLLAVLSRERERFWSREETALVDLVAELLVRVLDRESGERRLKERQAALRQSQKMDAVGRLAGGIAHEFNNLLMVIAGHTDALMDGIAEDGEVAADLREIHAATDRAASLTRQLLTLSGPETARPHPLLVDTVVREGARVWRRTLGEACVLTLQLDAEDAAVLGEPSDLEQILLNLLVNARDAMPSGGSVVLSTLRLPPAGPGEAAGEVELCVQDEGEGIPEERIPEIFEPFYSTKSPGRGTGLGLSIARYAAERLGGSILVEGRPGEGARFRVRLPETRERPAPERRPTAATAARGTGTILLAEDEDGVRRLMRRILQGAGYTVLEARDGAEALDRILAEPKRIDAVVSDMVMPRIGGSGLVQALRDHGVEMPVLFVSGYPQDVDGTPDGASGVRLLYKPFTREALVGAVAALLDE